MLHRAIAASPFVLALMVGALCFAACHRTVVEPAEPHGPGTDGAPVVPVPPPAPSSSPTASVGKKVAVNHRATATPCSTDKVAGDVQTRAPELMPKGSAAPACQKDSDCTDEKSGKNGRCAMTGGGRLPPRPSCVYDACAIDSDCGPKSACACGGAANDGHSCVAGNCATDADCGTDGFCSPSLGGCGNYGGTIGNYCHTPTDECTNNDECMAQPGGYCAWKDEVGHWQCSYGHCVG